MVFGTAGPVEITAIRLSTETIDREENGSAAEIRSTAGELGVAATVGVHSVTTATTSRSVTIPNGPSSSVTTTEPIRSS